MNRTHSRIKLILSTWCIAGLSGRCGSRQRDRGREPGQRRDLHDDCRPARRSTETSTTSKADAHLTGGPQTQQDPGLSPTGSPSGWQLCRLLFPSDRSLGESAAFAGPHRLPPGGGRGWKDHRRDRRLEAASTLTARLNSGNGNTPVQSEDDACFDGLSMRIRTRPILAANTRHGFTPVAQLDPQDGMPESCSTPSDATTDSASSTKQDRQLQGGSWLTRLTSLLQVPRRGWRWFPKQRRATAQRLGNQRDRRGGLERRDGRHANLPVLRGLAASRSRDLDRGSGHQW